MNAPAMKLSVGDLGEGLIAQFDGSTITLRRPHVDRPPDEVQMSPDQLARLMDFVWIIVNNIDREQNEGDRPPPRGKVAKLLPI